MTGGKIHIITAYRIHFLPVSKAVKEINCITDFGVSTAIITFFIVVAS